MLVTPICKIIDDIENNTQNINTTNNIQNIGYY